MGRRRRCVWLPAPDVGAALTMPCHRSGRMEVGFPFVDISFFAMVASFLVLRLRSVLGRRSGNERPRNAEFGGASKEARGTDNVVALPDRSKTTVPPDSPAAAGLAQVKAADPSFYEAEFLTRARAAFEMIVTAFPNGRTEEPRVGTEWVRTCTS